MKNDTFDKLLGGKPVRLYTLRNAGGMSCDITNYGGRVVRLQVPDREGNYADVVLGFDTLDEYLNTDEVYFGAVIGRVANRISNSMFLLDGHMYHLTANDGRNHIHGGPNGFHNQVWEVRQASENNLELAYTSPDGEEGYPGNLQVTLTYQLTDDNALRIDYAAVTDQPTPVSLTNHSFFNLKGAGAGQIADHLIQIHASQFTPIDHGMIPAGEICPVEGGPFDLRQPVSIGSGLANPDTQMISGLGYDHNYVPDGEGLRLVARVEEPASGRVMEVITDEPGMQFYSGNFLDGHVTGKGGKRYGYRSAFCLETQRYPDSPNQPAFPSCILHPGETWKSTTIYKFSTV